MIIDAGIGDKMDAEERGHLRHRSARRPRSRAGGRRARARADIDLVLASHLHFDHAGGFTARDADGALRAAFPARALRRRHGGVGRCDASARAEPRQLPRRRTTCRCRRPACSTCIDGDGAVMPGVRVRANRRPHACTIRSSMIESGGRTAVFAADLIPTTAHVDEPWIMGYDLYPMDTLAFKRAFVREAIDREYLIFFEHDPAHRRRLHPRDGRAAVRRAVLNRHARSDCESSSTSTAIRHGNAHDRSASSAAAVCTTWRS